MDVIPNTVEAVDVSRLTVEFGETGKYDRVLNETILGWQLNMALPDKHTAIKRDYGVKGSVDQGASPDT
ncbi:hypothetical protein C0995_016116, partial [Termitomyces sp. Mi166